MTCWASAWWIFTQTLAPVWFTSWGADSMVVSSSWGGGICTPFCLPCISDLLTSAKETVAGWHAYEITVNTTCISMSWGCCYLTIYLVAFGALTGDVQYVSHQFKSQYPLLDDFTLKASVKKRIVLIHTTKNWPFLHLQKRYLGITYKGNKPFYI